MNTLKINRMNDFYFKYLLGSEQRKHLTIQFLNAVLYDNEETQITDVFFLDKDQNPHFEHEKLSKLDNFGTDQYRHANRHGSAGVGVFLWG